MAKTKTTIKTDLKTAKRPPVVVVMGHIDHGKSTLLDYIRKTNLVAKEAGGITQHLNAYEVEHKDQTGQNKKITFLDTPGHESFQTMRERGSLISDVAILIVSAEEGVKAQTLEALAAIKKAGIPYVVAINKIDRPDANPDKIKQDLADNNILVESYGGKIPSVNISARSGAGIDELLEMVLLVAELEDLKGYYEAPATGFVLESDRHPKVGTQVTLIIKDGVLETGNFVVTGSVMAKIKRIENFLGQPVKTATFSSPVKVFGFTDIPAAGGSFVTFADKKEAEKYHREMIGKETKKASADSTDQVIKDQVIVPLVIKADTIGTLEAVQREVVKLDLKLVRLKTVQSGIGNISESDIRLLISSDRPLVIGFNVDIDNTARAIADRFNVTIEIFSIIYKLSEWLATEMEKRRPRITTDKIIGRAKILKLFNQMKNKQVVGGRVKTGQMIKGKMVKIYRRDLEIGKGKITNLQKNKVDSPMANSGDEFGMIIDAKIPLAVGDDIESFEPVTE